MKTLFCLLALLPLFVLCPLAEASTANTGSLNPSMPTPDLDLTPDPDPYMYITIAAICESDAATNATDAATNETEAAMHAAEVATHETEAAMHATVAADMTNPAGTAAESKGANEAAGKAAAAAAVAQATAAAADVNAQVAAANAAMATDMAQYVCAIAEMYPPDPFSASISVWEVACLQTTVSATNAAAYAAYAAMSATSAATSATNAATSKMNANSSANQAAKEVAAWMPNHVRPVQRLNSKLVDIDFDVTKTSGQLTVGLQISADGGSTWEVPAKSLTGAIGSVTLGRSLRITWDAGADWNQQVSAQTQFRLTVAELSGLVADSTNVTVDTSDAVNTILGTPTITILPTATSIIYGQTLEFSTLSGGLGSVSGSFAFTSPTTIPNAGTGPQGVTFTPTDTVNYKAATGTVSVTVSKATPTIITLPTATSIIYGQTLVSSILRGGQGSVGGSFTFTAPSTVPSVGIYSASYTFTPTDGVNYSTVTGTVSVTVKEGSAIYQVTNVYSGDGSEDVLFQNADGSLLSGGIVAIGYFAENYDIPSSVNQANIAAAVANFTPLSSALCGSYSASLEGSFPGYVEGEQVAGVNSSNLIGRPLYVFVGNASTLAASTSIAIRQMDVFRPNNPSIENYYGLYVLDFINGAPAPVIGKVSTFTGMAWPGAGYVSTYQSLQLTDPPAATITMLPTASAITYGQALASSALSGGMGSVAGSFAFASPTTIPNAGTASQEVKFTPTDAVNYKAATGTVSVTVNKATATVSLGSLVQAYDGTARWVSATTVPAGLHVNVTYDGTATVPVNEGNYAVVGTIDDVNYRGSVNGTLVVAMPIAITAQPIGVTANQGGSATFSVTATGTSPTYQWMKSGVAISGATGATLSLNNVQSEDAANYSVVVTNAVGSVTSGVASLQVIPTEWALFTAAESALTLANASAVNLGPSNKLSVITGSTAHSGGNVLKFESVDNGSTYAERTIIGPSLVSFSWQVSSEKNFDFFSYSIDGKVQKSVSGDGAWLTESLQLGSGIHTIRWTYSKDEADSSFDDAGYLDDLVIVEAYTNLEVTTAGAVVVVDSTLDYGTLRQDSAEQTQYFNFKNTGTLWMEVQATLPDGCGFVLDGVDPTNPIELGPGDQVTIGARIQTVVPGQKTVLLGILATDSKIKPPAITLSGYIQAHIPNMACSWSGGAIANGQTVALDLGTAPSDLAISVSNSGDAALNIASVSVSPTSDFQIVASPNASVAVNGSTTFTVRALDAHRGSHTAIVTIASDDPNTPSFSFPVTSQSYLAVAGGAMVSGTYINSGTVAGWSSATATLPNSSSGSVLKTGITPNSGDSTIGATFDGPGLLSWNWQVSTQQDYDWLLCEVNGTEVAGISTKTAAWQSQVVKIPAGASVRWIYRKDSKNQSGTDSGYLSDIRFSKFIAASTSFIDWSAANGDLPPTQLIPAGGMQAMFAWLGGVDPATGPAVGTNQASVSGGFYKYRYTISKAASGKIQPQISSDLVTWNSRKLSQAIVSEDDNSALMELSVPASGKVFSRFATDMPSFDSIKVQGGTLPSSSQLGAQGVPTFYIAKTETAWGMWQTVRTWAVAHGYDLAYVGSGNGDSYPVTNISWYQSVKWCNARSEMEGLTPVYTVNGTIYRSGNAVPVVNASVNGYRLPSEAEWEFAARGGIRTHNYYYSGSDDINAVAWYYYNSYSNIRTVGQKAGNELGLYDMSGNVSEWCFDRNYSDYWSYYYGYDYRIYRGGSVDYNAGYCSVMDRQFYTGPSSTSSYIGFRVARSSAQ